MLAHLAPTTGRDAAVRSQRKCVGYVPSALDSIVDHKARDSETLGPFGHRQCDSVMRQPNGVLSRAFVFLLLQHCRPSAVARLIVAVAVDTINRMSFGGRMSHVGKESWEMIPSLADFYAAPAVVLPRVAVRIVAAGSQPGPRPIGARFSKAMLGLYRSFHALNDS